MGAKEHPVNIKPFGDMKLLITIQTATHMGQMTRYRRTENRSSWLTRPEGDDAVAGFLTYGSWCLAGLPGINPVA